MITRLLDYDPLTGVTQYHHYDPVTETTTIESVQDIEPILNANKAMQNDTDYSRGGIKQEWWHAACIPIVVQERWLREHGITDVCAEEHWPRVRRLLNDPEYKWLKTTSGTI